MSLSEEQIALYSRQILVKQIGGRGQEKLCAAHARVDGDGVAARIARTYLAAGGSRVSDGGEALCPSCARELDGSGSVELGALVALAFQQRVLSGDARCPRHP